MHTLTIQTKYALGDRVRFNSSTQRCAGTGRIFAVTIYIQGPIDYIIEIDRGAYTDLQPGILEGEITYLGADA